MELLRTLLLGLVGGIVGWLLARFFLGPRLAWSAGIIRKGNNENDDPFVYQVKYQNVGWFRSVMSITLSGVLVWQDTRTTRRQIKLEISNTEVLRLVPGQNNILSFSVRDISDDALQHLRDAGHSAVADNPRRALEDLLSDDLARENSDDIVVKPHVLIRALVTDGWSGTQQYRQSMQYELADVYPDHTFRAQLGHIAKAWARGRRLFARMRSRLYRSTLRSWRRPSLRVIARKRTPNDADH